MFFLSFLKNRTQAPLAGSFENIFFLQFFFFFFLVKYIIFVRVLNKIKSKLESAVDGAPLQIPTLFANSMMDVQTDTLPHPYHKGGHVASLIKFHPVV